MIISSSIQAECQMDCRRYQKIQRVVTKSEKEQKKKTGYKIKLKLNNP